MLSALRCTRLNGCGLASTNALAYVSVAAAEQRRHVVQRDRDAGGLERADAGARRFAHAALGVEVAGDVDAIGAVRTNSGTDAGTRRHRTGDGCACTPRAVHRAFTRRSASSARQELLASNCGDPGLRGRRVLLHLLVAGGEAAKIVERGFRFRADRRQLAREPQASARARATASARGEIRSVSAIFSVTRQFTRQSFGSRSASPSSL